MLKPAVERALSFFAFFDASLMACFGALCFLLCFWYLEAICAPEQEKSGQTIFSSVRTTCTRLLFRLLLHQVVPRRNELQKRFKCFVVPFQGGSQLCCGCGHICVDRPKGDNPRSCRRGRRV